MSGLFAGAVAGVAVVALIAAGSAIVRVRHEAHARRRVVAAGSDNGGRSATGRRWAPSGWSAGGNPVRHVVARLGTGRRAERARRRADRDLPLLLDHITRHLRAGASLSAAVRAAASRSGRPDTQELADALAGGTGLADAVDAWERCCPTPSRQLAAAALGLAADAGGSVALVLDGVNDTLRDRIAVDREVAALSSQARASAWVLVVPPLVFAALAAAADPRVAAVLFGSAAGWGCLAGGLLLDAVAAVWMAKLTGRAR